MRALDVLARANLVACEDTRMTMKLLAIHGLRARLTTYHDHNAETVRPRLIERLKGGESVALVSDAGTPLVSDPGYKLVRDVIAAGISVTAVPGPSAVLTALVVSGLPTDRFLFAGFLPPHLLARQRAIAEIAEVRASLVLMESAKRLAATLADLAAGLGPRPAAVTRELTKMFEEVRSGSLDELARHYAEAGAPKGEIAIVIAPPGEAAPTAEADLDAALRNAMTQGSLKDAVALVAAATQTPRRVVYARALALGKPTDTAKPTDSE